MGFGPTYNSPSFHYVQLSPAFFNFRSCRNIIFSYARGDVSSLFPGVSNHEWKWNKVEFHNVKNAGDKKAKPDKGEIISTSRRGQMRKKS